MVFEKQGSDKITSSNVNANLSLGQDAYLRSGNVVNIKIKFNVTTAFTPTGETKLIRIDPAPYSGFVTVLGNRISGAGSDWSSAFSSGVCKMDASTGDIMWGSPPFPALTTSSSIWVDLTYIVN